MGAPEGNKNVVKGKLFESALKRALARAHGSVDAGLDVICARIVAEAESDHSIRRDIADRLDGKPKQSVDHGLSDEPENPIQKLVAAADELRNKIRGK